MVLRRKERAKSEFANLVRIMYEKLFLSARRERNVGKVLEVLGERAV